MESALMTIRLSDSSSSSFQCLSKLNARSLSIFSSLKNITLRTASEVHDGTDLSEWECQALASFWDAEFAAWGDDESITVSPLLKESRFHNEARLHTLSKDSYFKFEFSHIYEIAIELGYAQVTNHLFIYMTLICNKCFVAFEDGGLVKAVATSCGHIFCSQCSESVFPTVLRKDMACVVQCPTCEDDLRRRWSVKFIDIDPLDFSSNNVQLLEFPLWLA